jgi:hypothetical protein
MPKAQSPYPNEFAYLREQRTHALHEIQSTLGSLGATLKECVDPARWAATHPWATAGTAFGLGLTAGYVVAPGRAGVERGRPQAARQGPPVSADGSTAQVAGPGSDATPEASHPFRDKLAAGAKSIVFGAAYGLGRMALNQILEGLMTGMHPPEVPADPDSEYAAAHHSESFSWHPETPV